MIWMDGWKDGCGWMAVDAWIDEWVVDRCGWLDMNGCTDWSNG